jgi:hypothetical protein
MGWLHVKVVRFRPKLPLGDPDNPLTNLSPTTKHGRQHLKQNRNTSSRGRPPKLTELVCPFSDLRIETKMTLLATGRNGDVSRPQKT